MMLLKSWKKRKIIFVLLFAMIGGRILISLLAMAGVIKWVSPLGGASELSWIIPIVVPVVLISIMLVTGRKIMTHPQQMARGMEDEPLSEILQKRFVRGEITKKQYDDMKRILQDE